MKIDYDKENRSPYDMVIDIIEDWCNIHGYSDMIVLLKIYGQEENVYLECDSMEGWTWGWDWFEGGEIELLGFCPINKAIIPEEYMLSD